ncbi:MAG: TatD family hydrolase [Flavobacteriales bacterium]|nr:TatD family hydrolase [Flavobacteriales bacterium]
MNKWSDTHCHIYGEQFDQDRKEMLLNAQKAGVKRFFLPNIDSQYTDRLLSLVREEPTMCLPMTGLHPCSVKENFREELNEVRQLYRQQESRLPSGSKIVGVGEIGLDLYWDKSFLKEQQEAFITQSEWAKEWGLPIIIHVRDAFDEIFELMDQVNSKELTGIFHCFTGSEAEAQRIIGFEGFKLGIGGVVTFKNGGLDKVLPHVPLEYIVLETDSPYLAPVPYRGKRNESAYLEIIAQRVADIYEMPIEELSRITEANTDEIFKL